MPEVGVGCGRRRAGPRLIKPPQARLISLPGEFSMPPSQVPLRRSGQSVCQPSHFLSFRQNRSIRSKPFSMLAMLVA